MNGSFAARPPPWQRISKRRDDKQVAVELPIFLEELARALRAGLTIPAGIAATMPHVEGPLRLDVETMSARLEHGMSLTGALAQWAESRSELRSVRIVAAAVALAASAGGSIGKAIDSVAETIRDEIALEAEVNALAAQAKASALLVAILPLAFGAVGGVADPASLAFLFGTPLGLACLGLGLTLDLGGWLWMRRITGGDTP